jgi:hypothetical protein
VDVFTSKSKYFNTQGREKERDRDIDRDKNLETVLNKK